MSKRPPFIYGVTRLWAIAPSDDSQSKLFPVSRKLYFAVRIILEKWTADLVNLRDWDIRKQCRSIQVNSEGQVLTEVLSDVIPRLHAIYTAMNTGTPPPSLTNSFSTHGDQQPEIVR
jgi:hypothetical protein